MIFKNKIVYSNDPYVDDLARSLVVSASHAATAARRSEALQYGAVKVLMRNLEPPNSCTRSFIRRTSWCFSSSWLSHPHIHTLTYTGPFTEADLDQEIRNGAGRNGGWANRETERDGGWWDGKKEKAELDAQGEGANRYSYFWRTDNVMGYPEKDLPVRSTYEHDVTTGGTPYEHFWGGEDAIAKDVRGVSDFFKGDNDTPSAGSNDKYAMDTWFKEKGNSVPTDKAYKSLWRDDLQLGGDVAGLVDGDIYGDGGLVYTYRRSYDDDDAYDLSPWQQKGELTSVKDGSKGMGSWPWPLYNYAVDSTDHDVRHTQDEWHGAWHEPYDPLDKTFEEY